MCSRGEKCVVGERNVGLVSHVPKKTLTFVDVLKIKDSQKKKEELYFGDSPSSVHRYCG